MFNVYKKEKLTLKKIYLFKYLKFKRSIRMVRCSA